MINWALKTQAEEILFSIDEDIIEMWNSLVFLYAQHFQMEIYYNNYLFFKTSMGANFTKKEVINCLDCAYTLLKSSHFTQFHDHEDLEDFKSYFKEIKNQISGSASEKFQTCIIDCR